MRVFQLISSGGYYGAERVVLELSKNLAKKGLKVSIGIIAFSKDVVQEITSAAQESGIVAEVFICKKKIEANPILTMMRRIVKSNFDIIHTHNYKSNFFGFLSSLGLDKVRIATCHNWTKKDKKLLFYEYIDKRVLKRFDKIVVVSSMLKNELLRSGFDPNKVAVIYNGISIDDFTCSKNSDDIKDKFGIERSVPIIGTVGRLSPEKGYRYFLKAIPEIRRHIAGIKFLFIGDGPERKSLEKMASDYGISDAVIFTGKRDDVVDLLNIMDIFVLSSLNEGLPLSVLEAMASKKAVICTKVGEIPHIIVHRKNGILIEPGNVGEISKQIINLLKSNECMKKLGENAFYTVKQCFTSERMAEDYLMLYQDVINRKNQ